MKLNLTEMNKMVKMIDRLEFVGYLQKAESDLRQCGTLSPALHLCTASSHFLPTGVDASATYRQITVLQQQLHSAIREA